MLGVLSRCTRQVHNIRPGQGMIPLLSRCPVSCAPPSRAAPAALHPTSCPCLCPELRHYLRLLEQLHPPEGPESCLVDICCQVVALDQRDPGVQVLYIWDGTDAMPAPAT